ncbi:MAG: hypothetical protein ACXVCV_20150, partial [Polyangia bacterium]
KVRVATVEELQRAPGMSKSAAEAVVKYFRGDSPPAPAAESPASDQPDVAEDAAAEELDNIASEEEAAVDPRDEEEE